MSESPYTTVPAEWNATEAPLPSHCAYQQIELQARQNPDWLAVVRGSQRLSYGELNSRANRLAHWLMERGVGPGQIVALYGSRSPEQLVAWLAVQKAGGCYLPIDPDYPAGRVQQMLADSGTSVLLTDSLRARRLGELPEQSLQLDTEAGEFAEHSDHNPMPVVALADPLYLIYTSGSTGTPKGSLVSHRGAANLYEHYIRALRLGSSNRFLIVSSMAFDLTQKNLFCPLMVGGTVVLPDSETFDAELILDTIAREGVSNLNCTPSAFHGIIDGADAGTWSRLATLRQLALGGEPVNLAKLTEWRRHCGAELINGYGPTECSAVVAMHILPGDAPAPSDLPIGKPVANTRLHVLDAQLKPLPVGEEGELCVSGVQVGLGYLNRPEQTAERFLDHPQYGRLYRTGDRAQWNEDGTLHYLGRIDQQVKLRGFRIELGEIEAALAAQAGVKDAVVVVRQDGDSEPRLVAYLVALPGAALDAATLRTALARRLPDYMLPASWLFLDTLPLNANGKLDRRALPAPTTERPPLSVAYAAPTEPLEAALATLWAELLEVAPVGIDDPFFELGGSSLKAIQSVGRLGRQLGVKPLVVDLFAAGTVRRYALALRARHGDAVAARFGTGPAAAIKPAVEPRPAAPRPSVHDEVVIVGMAARLPGADSVEQFWDNLRNGVESIVPISEDELDAAGVPAEVRGDPAYVRRHATLADADCFDHQFFGVSPREAALMDPQQRLLLECAWAALEHAGYDPAHTPGRVGAYCGVARNSYFSHNLAGDPATRAQLGEVHITFGNDKDYAATHISHKLNLRGPALTAQTACSTGGVLLHLARRALLAGECDAALVGGARVVSPLKAGYPWIDGSIFSKDGRMRVFDAEGSGMIRGSGVACLLLKRRTDAERDGDTIYAVIRGSALNNDGSDKVSYTAPSVGGQAEVIGMALDDAGVSADTLSYVEAHGTATHLGDPIEVTALTQAWRQHTARSGFAKIGSVKSNIGHLDPAAALASTIKTALALKHRYIPASLGYENPNPQIDFASSPFVVAARGADWDGPTPRRAGVSSFGIGGTNAHLILEEAAAAPPVPADPRRWQLLPFAARTDAALEGLGRKLAGHFGSHHATPLADAAWTLQTGRSRFDKRAIVVAADAGGASRALQATESWARGTPLPGASLVFVFPGQGAQHPGMGRELYESEPLYQRVMDEGCEILQPLLGLDLRSVLYPAPAQAAAAADTLRQTGLAQPAIFLASYALARLWESLGLKPSLMLGHSVGEFVAATLAGVFTFADALQVLAARARLMQSMPAGSMLAVRLPEDKARALLPAEVDVAAVNAPASTIVSGPTPAIEALEAALKARDIGTARLHTSHAFHSSMMDTVLEPFAAEVASVPRGVPDRPLISTATGLPLTPEQARDPHYWARQLRGTVRFADAVAEALKQPGRVLLEVGPGQSLSGPLRQLVSAHGGGKATVVPSAPAAAQEEASAAEHFIQALGRLWIAGLEPDWIALHGGARQRVGLPTYAFARTRYWIEPSLSVLPAAVQAAALAPAADSAQDSAAPPADALRGRAVKVLSEITGMEFAPGDDGKSFLELGMDSLMLTQVAGRLKAEFRLDLKFRQLMEELSTLDKLCAHLKTHASGAPVTPAPDGNQPPELEAPVDDGKPKKAFGAAVRITKSAGETLTPRQQKSLDALIARYNARTAKSKASAQQHRAYFADPRTVSGFRPLWKETVYPIVSTRSDGAHLWDVDGNQYIDTVNGFGATIFGHKPAFVDAALREQIDKGYEVGPVQDYVGETARLFTKLTRLERVAFCNTGSEAVSAAVRCARTVTGRDLVVSFNGDYHGIQDEVIVRPGPKGRGVPAAGGIPFTNTASTLILDYGDPKSLEIIAARADEIAAVMVEPVQSRNMDLQPKDFLHECRRLADASGYAFIMDEVITGFRAAPGGAQEYFGVQADLASYGKVFGGGMPVGAVAGKAKFMDALDGGAWQFGDGSVPEAGVTYFAGTFVRHPMVMAAVHAVLKYLDANRELQPTLSKRTTAFVERLNELCRETGAPLRFPHFSSTFRLEWTQDEPFYELFAVYLRERGLHTYDGRVQVMTIAHTEEVLEQLYGIFRDSILAMQRDGLLGRAGEPVKIGFDAEAAGGIFYKPPLPGAKLGRDAQGNPAWFVSDPKQPWKYLQIGARA